MITILVYALSLGAGASAGLQASVNAALARFIGIAESSLVSFGGSFLCMVLLMAIGLRSNNLAAATSAPPHLLLGGLFGVIIVTSANWAVPLIGVTAYSVALILGQLVTALVLDHLGAFGHAPYPIDATRLVGVGLLLLGMKLVMR